MRKTDLHEIEVQLMPLFHVKNTLERIELERKLKEAQDEAWEEQLTVVRHNLEELQKKFEQVGQGIYLQTGNQFSFYF